MVDVCCPPIVGGRIYISWGDKRIECSGSMKMSTAGEMRDAKVTNSGRLVGTVEARPQTFEVDMWNICGADPMELWRARCHVDVTVVEEDTGRRHRYTDAFVFGEPVNDPTTGLFSGIKVATDNYSQI